MCPSTRGRPPKDESQKKTIRFEMRLKSEENEIISSLADKLQLSKTDVILRAISFLAENTK